MDTSGTDLDRLRKASNDDNGGDCPHFRIRQLIHTAHPKNDCLCQIGPGIFTGENRNRYGWN